MYDFSALTSSIGEELYGALVADGYVSVMSNIDPKVYPHAAVTKNIVRFDTNLRAACELFSLGCTVSLRSLSERLRNAVLNLECSGIIKVAGEFVRTDSLSLYLLQGMLYFAETPSPLISLYFGEDSVALISRLGLLRPSGGTALDLCSGPGIQGLLAARMGYDVTAVEINPLAANLALCNAAINGYTENYRVLTVSIEEFFDSVAVARYDRVYANPPLVPVPDGMPYGLVGAGGTDGLKFTRSIIDHAGDVLAPGGQLMTIGISGGDASGPYVADVVDSSVSRYGLQAVLSVLSRCPVEPGSEWLNLVVASLDGYALEQGCWSQTDVLAAYRLAGVSEVYAFALLLAAPSNPDAGGAGHGAYKYVNMADGDDIGLRWWL